MLVAIDARSVGFCAVLSDGSANCWDQTDGPASPEGALGPYDLIKAGGGKVCARNGDFTWDCWTPAGAEDEVMDGEAYVVADVGPHSACGIRSSDGASRASARSPRPQRQREPSSMSPWPSCRLAPCGMTASSCVGEIWIASRRQGAGIESWASGRGRPPPRPPHTLHRTPSPVSRASTRRRAIGCLVALFAGQTRPVMELAILPPRTG